jgi:gluconolactonase
MGNTYFTSLSKGIIYQITKEGSLKEWARTPCPNGQIVLSNGDHLLCDSKTGCVKRFDAQGVFIKDEIYQICDQMRIEVPNDLVEHHDGTIFFTDSVRHHGKVAYFHPDGRQGILMTGLDYPNGLVFSADGQYLYVAESYQNRILRYDFKTNEYTVFANLPKNPSGSLIGNLPDGLTIDRKGNLYVAHFGMQAIQILNATGDWMDTLDTGLPLTSNVCFSDPHTLVVTGGWGEPGPGAVVKIHFEKEEIL